MPSTGDITNLQKIHCLILERNRESMNVSVICAKEAKHGAKVLERWEDLTVAESGKASYKKRAGF